MAHDNLPIRVFLDWCTIFCTRPPRGANCHPILALAPPIQMNIARSPSGRPLLPSRRRVPALSVSLREAILAYRPHHPDHLEEEPAAGPSLTTVEPVGSCLSSTQWFADASTSFKPSLRCQSSLQVKSMVSSLLRTAVKSMVSSLMVSGPSHVYGVKFKSSSTKPAREIWVSQRSNGEGSVRFGEGRNLRGTKVVSAVFATLPSGNFN